MAGHREAGQGRGGQRTDAIAAGIPDCGQGMWAQNASLIAQSSHENMRSGPVKFTLAFLQQGDHVKIFNCSECTLR